MKLLFTYTLGERLGGSEHILWTILRNLDRSRFEPVVVFLAAGPFEREVAALGIKTYVVPLGRFRQARLGLRAVASLTRIIRKERPDLVINFILKAQLYGAPAAIVAGRGRRIVWWQHDMPGRQALDRVATILPARGIGTDSTASAEAQQEYWPRRRSFPVLPGIAEPRTVSKSEVDALRTKLAIPQGRFVVGIVGRLQEWKGQHRLLSAVADLRAASYDVHCLIVGGTQHGAPPDYENALHRQVEELGLDGAVTFSGQVAEAGPYIQLMDALVNASDPEPFGLVLLEAMSVGVPVVAVDAAGPTEITEGGRHGVLVPSGAPDDLAGGIRQIMDDRSLRERLVASGAKRYRARFTIERMLEDFQRQIEELGAP